MKIDLFTHFVPPAFADYLSRYSTGRSAVSRWQRIPALIDLDAHFRIMDEFGEYAQVPSLANPAIEAYGDPSETPEIARVANDALAELCERHRARFPSFVANLPMNNPPAAVEEAERAVKQLGAAGCLVYSNVLGAPLSSDRFFGIFQKMAELDRPIWLHPIRGPEHSDYLAENRSEHELWFTFGWPACWHVVWTVIPTTVRNGAPQIRWRVQVERATSGAITYWISITNLTDADTDIEARYAVLAAD